MSKYKEFMGSRFLVGAEGGLWSLIVALTGDSFIGFFRNAFRTETIIIPVLSYSEVI